MGTRESALLAAILVTRFLGFFARLSVAPFFPEFMARYGVGYTEMGVLLSAFLVGYAVSLFPAGVAADRYPPRRLLVAGLLLLAVTFPGVVLAPHWLLAAAARLLSGVGVALLFGPAFKVILVYLPATALGTALSLTELAVALGMLFALTGAPLLAAWLPVTPLHLWLGAVSLAAAVAVALIPLPAPRQGLQPGAGPPALGALLDRRLALVAAAFILGNFVFSGALGWVPTFVQEGLGRGRDGGAIASGVMLVTDAAVALFVGRLTDRVRPLTRLVQVSCVLSMGATALLGLTRHWPAVLVAAAGLGLAIPLNYVPMTAINASVLGPEMAGAALGLVNAVGQVAGAFSSGVFGWLVDATGSFRIIWWVSLAAAGAQMLVVSRVRR